MIVLNPIYNDYIITPYCKIYLNGPPPRRCLEALAGLEPRHIGWAYVSLAIPNHALPYVVLDKRGREVGVFFVDVCSDRVDLSMMERQLKPSLIPRRL